MQNIPPNLYNADLPIPTKGPPAWFDTVHVSLAGSFIAAEGVFRARNEISSGASDPPFGTIPFQNSPLWSENEFRMSAQQSRIALKATGDIDPAQHLKGYYEMDFLGAASTANSRESNSYTPRIRQAYFAYDNDNYHFHMSAGQEWSLLTQNRVGMLNGTENTPLTIDAQYVVGFNWARQPAIRFVEDWNKIAWFGVSVESSQTAFASNGAAVAGTPNTGLTVPPGLAVNATNTCNNRRSVGQSDLMLEQRSAGHHRKSGSRSGLGSLRSARLCSAGSLTRSVPRAFCNQWSTKTTFGWGVGGNALMPVWPKFVDLQGSVLYGQGIGRYASSQLADAIIGSNGQVQPITSVQFLVGGVAHPFAGNDIYVYYGQEQTQRNAWTVGGVNGGWGNLAFAESGCGNAAAAAGLISPAAFNTATRSTCTANIQRAQELTVGFWQDVYKGDLGRVRFGVQYEFVQLDLFNGMGSVAGGLHPNNNIVFFSLATIRSTKRARSERFEAPSAKAGGTLFF